MIKYWIIVLASLLPLSVLAQDKKIYEGEQPNFRLGANFDPGGVPVDSVRYQMVYGGAWVTDAVPNATTDAIAYDNAFMWPGRYKVDAIIYSHTDALAVRTFTLGPYQTTVYRDPRRKSLTTDLSGPYEAGVPVQVSADWSTDTDLEAVAAVFEVDQTPVDSVTNATGPVPRPVTFTWTPVMGEGQINVKIRDTHGRESSETAIVVSVVTTPPTLSNGVATNITTSGADCSVDSDEQNGTIYLVVDENTTTPTATQVKNSLNAAGAAAHYSVSQLALVVTETFSVATLSENTQYACHMVQEDSESNFSNVVTVIFTTDSAQTWAQYISTHHPNRMADFAFDDATAGDTDTAVNDAPDNCGGGACADGAYQGSMNTTQVSTFSTMDNLGVDFSTSGWLSLAAIGDIVMDELDPNGGGSLHGVIATKDLPTTGEVYLWGTIGSNEQNYSVGWNCNNSGPSDNSMCVYAQGSGGGTVPEVRAELDITSYNDGGEHIIAVEVSSFDDTAPDPTVKICIDGVDETSNITFGTQTTGGYNARANEDFAVGARWSGYSSGPTGIAGATLGHYLIGTDPFTASSCSDLANHIP